MHAPYVEEPHRRTTLPLTGRPATDWTSACRSDAAVLFTGPTETAERIAREIHGLSGWRSGPFVVVDCGMPEPQLDTMLTWLFVDEARDRRSDVFTRPRQYGVVFLREIRKLSPAIQAKLTEYLWRQRLPTTLGPRRRIMATTSTPLLPRALGGPLMDELYYRLTPIHILIHGPSTS
jgi:DNA-binding NtrC family response regulator